MIKIYKSLRIRTEDLKIYELKWNKCEGFKEKLCMRFLQQDFQVPTIVEIGNWGEKYINTNKQKIEGLSAMNFRKCWFVVS